MGWIGNGGGWGGGRRAIEASCGDTSAPSLVSRQAGCGGSVAPSIPKVTVLYIVTLVRDTEAWGSHAGDWHRSHQLVFYSSLSWTMTAANWRHLGAFRGEGA